jgi:hypothetical protein
MNANKDRMATIIIEQTATQWGIPLPEKSLNRRSTRKRTTAKNSGRGKATHASLLLMAHIREVAHRRFSRCAALRGFAFLLRESAGAGPRPGIPGSPRSGRAKRGQPASRPRGYGPVAIGGD